MRPLQIVDKPPFRPNVCAICGTGNEREHWVDLGIDVAWEKTDDHGQLYLSDGAVYLCNICIASVMVSYLSKVNEFNRQQLVARGLIHATNAGEIRTLQNEIKMLRNQLNARDNDIQGLRFAMQSKLDAENNTVSPPKEPETPTADDLVNEMLGNDENDNTTGTGTTDSDSDGRSSDPEGTDSESDTNESDAPSDKPAADFDSLTVTHLAFGQFGSSGSSPT